MSKIVESKRILYIPSEFAKKSLIYLQEVGESKTLEKHTNSRNKLDSYLFFIVLDGNGTLNYNNTTYHLQKGSCVFIDCNNQYSHTSDNWTIKWIHFNGNPVKDLYQKYINLNQQPYFISKQLIKYIEIIENIYLFAKLNSNINDLSIYNGIVSVISIMFYDTVDQLNTNKNKRIYDIKSIKNYIDNNYLKNPSLSSLENIFYINKYYLTRLFKNTYGTTINSYIINKKINKAKELLRFSELNIKDISNKCGINDYNYFTRMFKKREGITPSEYRLHW